MATTLIIAEANTALGSRMGANAYVAGKSVMRCTSTSTHSNQKLEAVHIITVMIDSSGNPLSIGEVFNVTSMATRSGGIDSVVADISPPSNYTGLFEVRVGFAYKSVTNETVSARLTSVAYSSPQVTSFSVVRANSAGTPTDSGQYAIFSVSAAITSLISKNTYAYRIEWRLAGASTWTASSTNTSAGYACAFNKSLVQTAAGALATFAAGSAYEFRFLAIDLFETSAAYASIGTTFAVFDTTANGTGLAIGKRAEANDLFDVNPASRFRKAVQMDVPLSRLYGGLGASVGSQYELMRALGIQYGQVDMSVPGQGSAEVWILFDPPFAYLPKIQLALYANGSTSQNTSAVYIEGLSVGSLGIRVVKTSTGTGSFTVMWQATASYN